MPRCIWYMEIPLKGKNRRKKERIKKRLERGKQPDDGLPQIQFATYRSIAEASNMYQRIYHHITKLFSLSDLARIFGVSRSTTSRWYSKGLLPKPYIYHRRKQPRYIKEQIIPICIVLNQIFDNGYRQYRQSHELHRQMIEWANEIAMRRIPYKAVKPKPPWKPRKPRPLSEKRQMREFLQQLQRK